MRKQTGKHHNFDLSKNFWARIPKAQVPKAKIDK